MTSHVNKSQVSKVIQLLCSQWTKRYILAALLNIISKEKSQGIDEKQYRELYADKWDKKNIVVVFEEYEKKLDKQNLVVNM